VMEHMAKSKMSAMKKLRISALRGNIPVEFLFIEVTHACSAVVVKGLSTYR
jgi:hypothetical protein